MRRIAVFCTILMMAQVVLTGCASGTQESDVREQTEETSAAADAAQTAAAGTTRTAAAGGTSDQDGPAPSVEPGAVSTDARNEGHVLNIYCRGEDFRNRVQDFVPGYEKVSDESGHFGDVEVRWHIYSDKSEYLDTLDQMLRAQTEETPAEEDPAASGEDSDEPEEGSEDDSEEASEGDAGEGAEEAPEEDAEEASEEDAEGDADENKEELTADDRIDLFIADESDLPHFARDSFSLDVVSEIGLSEESLADQFPFTRQAATDDSGVQRAVTWQALPGVFVYRRSVAGEVLGTDDPARVQEAVSDWEKFSETAELAKDYGYYMLSGYDDAYQVYSDNVSRAWVVDGEIRVDDHLLDWAEQTREFADAGYVHGTEMWSEDWYADHRAEGEVFGFFDSSWGIHFTLADKALGNLPGSGEEEGEDTSDEDEPDEEEEETEDAVGDYAICMGPEPFHYAGSYILAAAGGDNPILVRHIMNALTCDPENMKRITEDIQELTNTMSGMEALCESAHESEVLGGQDPMPVFLKIARSMKERHMSAWDSDLSLGFQVSMRDYITGRITKDAAVDNFYGAVAIRYPELEVAEEEEETEE